MALWYNLSIGKIKSLKNKIKGRQFKRRIKMGTNYYLHTKDKRLVAEHFPAEYTLTDMPDFGYEVHLCKMSAGWKTLFQAHKFAYNSVKEMTAFFRQNKDKITIYDEYDDKQDLEEFIDLYVNRDKLAAQHSQRLVIDAQGGIRRADDTTKSYITTPIDHLAYGDFMSEYRYFSGFESVREYWNDDEGYNFCDRDFC